MQQRARRGRTISMQHALKKNNRCCIYLKQTRRACARTHGHHHRTTSSCTTVWYDVVRLYAYLTPRRLRALDKVVQEGRAGLAPRERAGLTGAGSPVAVAQVQHQKLHALAHLRNDERRGVMRGFSGVHGHGGRARGVQGDTKRSQKLSNFTRILVGGFRACSATGRLPNDHRTPHAPT